MIVLAHMIEYKLTPDLDVDLAHDLYVASTLGERRPVDDRERFAAMIRNANLTITAWDGDLLVGISRSVTDWVWMTYLADLAVRVIASAAGHRQGADAPHAGGGAAGQAAPPGRAGRARVLPARRIHTHAARLVAAARGQDHAMTEQALPDAPTDRTRVRRLAERGRYETRDHPRHPRRGADLPRRLRRRRAARW